tara:strand:+ start:132 stop:407 length:276 start_codon:yes stop_codon:yes gene_type:complete
MVESIGNLNAADSLNFRRYGISGVSIHQDCFEKSDKSRLVTTIASMHDTQSGNFVERYVSKNTMMMHVNRVQSHRLLLLVDLKSTAQAAVF